MLVVMDGQCLRTILNALPELGQYLVVNVGLGTVLQVVLLFLSWFQCQLFSHGEFDGPEVFVYDSIGVTSSHEVSFVVEQHLGEVCLLGVCPEVPDGFSYSYAFASARWVVRVLSDIQLSVGGFNVCFGVQFAHVRLVWINLFVGNDVEED